MEPTTTMRRPCFIGEDDDGFASISHFSTNNNSNNTNNDHVINYQTQPYIMRRKNSLRNIPSFNNMATTTTTTTLVYSPRTTTRLQSPHFLESCSLCRKPLGGNRDIFMYRGDTPFCSEECRQEQIEVDEAKEKNWNIKSMMRSKNESKNSSSTTTPSKPQNYSFRTSTIAAA